MSNGVSWCRRRGTSVLALIIVRRNARQRETREDDVLGERRDIRGGARGAAGGLRQLALGGVAIAVTFLVGSLIGGHVGRARSGPGEPEPHCGT
jgi:hypothetical protein